MRNIILKSAVALALGIPLVASAESTLNTVGAPVTTNARVDFTIIIPRFISLQVGAAGAGINLITFDMTATPGNVGNAVAVAATVGSGDLGSGVVTARVKGNNGQVTLTAAAAAGGLVTPAADTIPFTEISTTAAILTSATALPAPVLVNGTSASVLPTLAGKVTNQDARWTYNYANTNVVAAGTYGGVAVNGGRVTYTASMP